MFWADKMGQNCTAILRVVETRW